MEKEIKYVKKGDKNGVMNFKRNLRRKLKMSINEGKEEQIKKIEESEIRVKIEM